MINLLRDRTVRGKRDAAPALFNLSVFHGNVSQAAGAVPLVNVLTDDTPGLTEIAVSVYVALANQL